MQSEALRRDLVAANHILASEGVLDVFGHVSARSAEREDEYLLARAVSPEIVTRGDILRFDLDSEPVDPAAPASYSERVIHGEIYKARPDVRALCHFHAPSIMPFCITGARFAPVSHVGATVGANVPIWSSRAEFGDTDLLVRTAEQGASLARALGENAAVLMRNHGAVVVGRTLQEAIFRAVHLCRDAQMQLAAAPLGRIEPLTQREIELAGAFNLRQPVLDRAWNYWMRRLRGNDLAEAAE